MDPNTKHTFDFNSAPIGGGEGANYGEQKNWKYPEPSSVEQGPQVIPVETTDEGGYKGAHPIAAFFHVCFKLAAILIFLLGGIFGLGYVLLLVITVLILAADFWTTKNVTGRILVAMRWWNEVQEDGTAQWIFESVPDSDNRVNAYDNWFFWVTTAANCLIWLLLLFFNLLSLKYLPITLSGLLLSGANFVGYFKCRRDAKQKVTSYMLSQAAERPQATGQVASFFLGGGVNNAATTTTTTPPVTGNSRV